MNGHEFEVSLKNLYQDGGRDLHRRKIILNNLKIENKLYFFSEEF